MRAESSQAPALSAPRDHRHQQQHHTLFHPAADSISARLTSTSVYNQQVPEPQQRQQHLAPFVVPTLPSAQEPPFSYNISYTQTETQQHPLLLAGQHPVVTQAPGNLSLLAPPPVPRNLPRRALNHPNRMTEGVHRVWVLYCSHCDMFLTDRGMRAVLLLRPNMPLFSSDAHPCNCGPAMFSDETDPLERTLRTCDCLTQTLCCFGCGNALGYHIIQPCWRCHENNNPNQNAAPGPNGERPKATGPNGHRFVFHCDEVQAVQRRYIPGDPGIIKFTQPPMRCASPSPGNATADSTTVSAQLNDSRVRQTTGPSEKDTSMPEDDSFGLTEESVLAPHGSNFQSHPRTQPQATTQQPRRQADRTPKHVLTAGSPVYWHYLVSGGERAAPRDPARVRPAVPKCGR